MGVEIERKYLVATQAWKANHAGTLYRQGYIPTADPQTTVRVRIAGTQGYITFKGPARGLVRPEFEYPIPLEDAESLLTTFCQPPIIEKRRYRITFEEAVWEVDEFLGANAGLVLAEIELSHPDQHFSIPPWAGPEVTADKRYYNASLARNPFSRWGESPPNPMDTVSSDG